MPRKKKLLGLKPGPADETMAKIRNWKDSDNPPSDELVEWLNHTSSIFWSTCAAFHKHKDLIAKIGGADLDEAQSVVINCLNFIDRSDAARELLASVGPGRVCDAFVEGVRVGLLYERVLSHIDGRVHELAHKKRQRLKAADTTNEAHLQLHDQYQAAVEKTMAKEKLKYHPACQKVADELKVSEKTVRNHTTNPATGSPPAASRKAL